MDKRVQDKRKIGLLGGQLVISAIGASLQENPDFDVCRIDEDLLPEALDARNVPDVVVFDLAATEPHFAMELIHADPKTIVIGIDLAQSTMLVLFGRQVRLRTAEDLVRVIESVTITRADRS